MNTGVQSLLTVQILIVRRLTLVTSSFVLGRSESLQYLEEPPPGPDLRSDLVPGATVPCPSGPSWPSRAVAVVRLLAATMARRRQRWRAPDERSMGTCMGRPALPGERGTMTAGPPHTSLATAVIGRPRHKLSVGGRGGGPW